MSSEVKVEIRLVDVPSYAKHSTIISGRQPNFRIAVFDGQFQFSKAGFYPDDFVMLM